MRLWSISPRYLDRQGLLAVWREGLLAQKVLLGKTKAFKNHPQLDRFKKCFCPEGYIGNYLWFIVEEAKNRGYNFNTKKIEFKMDLPKLSITKGQLEYEFKHLQKKLHERNYEKYRENNIRVRTIHEYEPHPLFKVIEGDIEKWEKIK